MAVRQDSVQISIKFITDESKQLAQTTINIKKLQEEIRQAQKELDEAGKGAEGFALKMGAAADKVAEKQKKITEYTKKMLEAQAKGDEQSVTTFQNLIKQEETALKRYEKNIEKLKTEHKELGDSAKIAAGKIALITQKQKELAIESAKIGQIDLKKVAPTQLIGVSKTLSNLALNTADPAERAKIEASAKAANNQLKEYNQNLKGVSKTMNEVRTDQGAFFNGMAAMVGKAMIVWYALKNVISSLFKPSQLASEMENALISFETMLGSARNARKLVNEIVQLAASTPFETAELTDYVKRLLAMGIESTKVILNLRQLGDIAAGVGKEKLPQIVLAFGQVAAKTKLAGGELKQFTEAGVPLVAELAKVMGVAESKIFDMVSAGQIGFKDVEKAIANMTSEGGKFAGLMGKQAQTTEGLMSTLKDNISLTLAAFGDGFNQAFKEILRSTIAFTNGLDRDKIREWGVAVGNAVKFVIEFTPALLKLMTIFATFQTISLASTALKSFETVVKSSTTFNLLMNSGLARTILLQTALNRLWTASALPFWGAAIVAATFAVQALTERITAQTIANKDLQNSQLEGAKAAKVEMQNANDLFAILRDGSAAYDTKKEALKRIMELYPQYLGDIKTEKGLLNNLDEAQKRVNQGIIESAFARIKAQEIEKRGSERLAREIELQKAKERALTAQTQRDNAKSDVTTGLNTYDTKTRLSITAGSEANAVNDLTQRNKLADDADIYFFKNFSGLALQTSKIISQNLTPSWEYLNNEITTTKKLLAASPNDEGLKKTLASLEKELRAEQLSAVKGETQKIKEVDELSAKAAEKRKKKELKALKDQYDILLKEDEVQYQKRLLLFERAYFNKSLTESDFVKKENALTSTHYKNQIDVYQAYLNKLIEKGQTGGEEYLNIEKKKFELERKLAENRAQLRRPEATITAALPLAQGAGVQQSPLGTALTQIQGVADVEKTVMANRFRDLVFGEQQLQIARLQVQKDAYDKQLELLTEAGLKDTKQYEAIAKKKEQTDNELHQNKERLKDLEQQMENAKMGLLNESFSFAIDLLARDEAARKKNATAIKAFETGQVIVNGIAEVSKIWKVHGANPILAGILTAAAVIRGVGAITKIASTKFAGGGFTSSGSSYKDETGHTPVGVVHNDEWVGPKWMTQNPRLRPVFNLLENVRVKGYADGGFVNTTPQMSLITPPSVSNVGVDISQLVNEFKGLRNDVRDWQTRLKAEIYRDEYEAAAMRDEADRQRAAL